VKSWPSPDLPDLPGLGHPLRLYDTASDAVRTTEPGNVARMYVCGITPYDATHMGHAFTYVTFDTINRAWRDAGHDVHYVQNVTDIDDPLLERAVATGQDWVEIAERETALFREDMEALNVLPPRDYIGAVESIPSVAAHVETLQEMGCVYGVDEDLYFRVHSDSEFGTVSRLTELEMMALFAERGGDPTRAGKEHPLDCLVWQAARPDEPSWDTSLGHGRPGWHIECAAIALDYLGMTIDVQGGGSDLIFPHHEMSASEAQVLRASHPFAKHYVHSAMVGWQGHKMSKSRGNLVFVSQLRHDGVDPAALRLALLAHHYRSDWEWSDEGLSSAVARLELWRAAAAAVIGPDAADLLAHVRAALADDLQTPVALSAVDNWARMQQAGQGVDADGPALMRQIVDALLGVRL
jgi:L-cysteine:1D-myo-inositol 2-amino-2-deoxy-alpha-D-glucopyranoside ligase